MELRLAKTRNQASGFWKPLEYPDSKRIT